jgi:hypothetical protein
MFAFDCDMRRKTYLIEIQDCVEKLSQFNLINLYVSI